MKLSTMVVSKAALIAILTQSASSFTPSTFVPRTPLARHTHTHTHTHTPTSTPTSSTQIKLQEGFADQCFFTPEGFGFSSSAERIIDQAKRGNGGFYKAQGDARVIDVMAGITEGEEDVALVYDGDELLGIFTEKDYIKVS